MLSIKKIDAKNLLNILDLFEGDFEKEEKFVQEAERKQATYTIDIAEENTIFENIGNSENEIFFNVYLSDSDIEELADVGEVEFNYSELENIVENIEEYVQECGKWEGNMGIEMSSVLEMLEQRGYEVYTQNDLYVKNGEYHTCNVPILVLQGE